jgi:hypothetical protein
VFFYTLNLAPMLFETFTSDRIWASNPPDSFHMFLGQYGHKTAHYWKIVSPLALVTFVLSIAVNWQVDERKVWLAAAFVIYLAIQVSTMAFFVPEQERLITDAGSLSPETLRSRAHRWLSLNNFRVVGGVLAYVLLMGAVLARGVPS